MISRLSLMDFAGIAGFIGMVGAGVSVLLIHNQRSKMSTLIANQPYYEKAFKILKQNPMATDLIGEPIHKKKINFTDTQNNCIENLSTRLKVPFKGLKKSGHLFLWADRQHIEEEWVLRRIELIFSDIKDKKVVVFKNENKPSE